MGCTSVVARAPTIRAGMCVNHLSDLTGSDSVPPLVGRGTQQGPRRLECRNGDRRGPGAPEGRRDRAQQGDEGRPAGSCQGDADREIGAIRRWTGGPNTGEGARRLLDVGELLASRHTPATSGLTERAGRLRPERLNSVQELRRLNPDALRGILLPELVVRGRHARRLAVGREDRRSTCRRARPDGQCAGKLRCAPVVLGIRRQRGYASRRNPLNFFGSPTWARTRDLRINSPALYQLSYRGTASNYSRRPSRRGLLRGRPAARRAASAARGGTGRRG